MRLMVKLLKITQSTFHLIVLFYLPAFEMCLGALQCCRGCWVSEVFGYTAAETRSVVVLTKTSTFLGRPGTSKVRLLLCISHRKTFSRCLFPSHCVLISYDLIPLDDQWEKLPFKFHASTESQPNAKVLVFSRKCPPLFLSCLFKAPLHYIYWYYDFNK